MATTLTKAERATRAVTTRPAKAGRISFRVTRQPRRDLDRIVDGKASYYLASSYMRAVGAPRNSSPYRLTITKRRWNDRKSNGVVKQFDNAYSTYSTEIHLDTGVWFVACYLDKKKWHGRRVQVTITPIPKRKSR